MAGRQDTTLGVGRRGLDSGPWYGVQDGERREVTHGAGGLLAPPPRRPSGYRAYRPETVERVRLIKWAQGLGFTLREITDLARVPADHVHGRTQRVRARAGQAVNELPDGFALRLRPDAGVFAQVAEWITLERRCCPFLTLALEWSARDVVTLSLRGEPEVKAFLATMLARTS